MKKHLNSLKNDLVETPISKHKFKNFSKELKDIEKKGFEQAIKFTFQKILQLPRKIHWKIILELADFAKRESKFNEAKILFKLISYIQPFAY